MNDLQKKTGAFEINIEAGQATVTRYFKYPDAEIEFQVRIKNDYALTTGELHHAALKTVISHLQKMVDAGEAEKKSP